VAETSAVLLRAEVPITNIVYGADLVLQNMAVVNMQQQKEGSAWSDTGWTGVWIHQTFVARVWEV